MKSMCNGYYQCISVKKRKSDLSNALSKCSIIVRKTIPKSYISTKSNIIHFQDAGTSTTIQEILTNIQGQQTKLAQTTFPTIHFYIFGYLLIGVTIGICVYVYVQKKKKSSRQSVGITQPHRFAVPSRRVQRSSYP